MKVAITILAAVLLHACGDGGASNSYNSKSVAQTAA